MSLLKNGEQRGFVKATIIIIHAQHCVADFSLELQDEWRAMLRL